MSCSGVRSRKRLAQADPLYLPPFLVFFFALKRMAFEGLGAALRFWILAFFCARSAFCFVTLRSMVVVLVKGAPSAPSSCIASGSADRARASVSLMSLPVLCSVAPFKCSCLRVCVLNVKCSCFRRRTVGVECQAQVSLLVEAQDVTRCTEEVEEELFLGHSVLTSCV